MARGHGLLSEIQRTLHDRRGLRIAALVHVDERQIVERRRALCCEVGIPALRLDQRSVDRLRLIEASEAPIALGEVVENGAVQRIIGRARLLRDLPQHLAERGAIVIPAGMVEGDRLPKQILECDRNSCDRHAPREPDPLQQLAKAYRNPLAHARRKASRVRSL